MERVGGERRVVIIAGPNGAGKTTLSGRMYADRIRDWQRRDYFVTLFFLSLSTPELAIARVKQRVCEGGHSIPEDVIRRRYEAGLQNFSQIYKDLVDEWLHFDNSGAQPVIIDIGQR